MNFRSQRSFGRGFAGVLPGRWLLLLAAGSLIVLAGGVAPEARAATKDTCVECHSDARFLVQNKKLYDYYQSWQLTIHSTEGVSCVDCHGGNPKATDKDAAHGGAALGSASQSSPLNYRNIPATCAKCHKLEFDKFRQSRHFRLLKSPEEQKQAPNCVTCHGSVNTAVLNVATVRKTCHRCHNEETRNNPEIPADAELVLNHFLSIHRYYRFIALKAQPEDAQSFFRVIDPVITELNAEWHSFDLESIHQKTQDLVNVLKVKRTQILEARKK
jgi:cytochrome c553